MDLYVVIAMALSAFVIVRELIGILATRAKIGIKGKTSGRKIAVVMLLAGLIILIPYHRLMRENLPLVLCYFGVFSVFLCIQAGFGESGAYYNGSEYRYQEIEYYMITREWGKTFSLRLHIRRDRTRKFSLEDLIIFFPQSCKEEVLSKLKSEGIHDWDEFSF